MKSIPRSGFTSKMGAAAANAATPRKLRLVNRRPILMSDSLRRGMIRSAIQKDLNRLTRSWNSSDDGIERQGKRALQYTAEMKRASERMSRDHPFRALE